MKSNSDLKKWRTRIFPELLPCAYSAAEIVPETDRTRFTYCRLWSFPRSPSHKSCGAVRAALTLSVTSTLHMKIRHRIHSFWDPVTDDIPRSIWEMNRRAQQREGAIMACKSVNSEKSQKYLSFSSSQESNAWYCLWAMCVIVRQGQGHTNKKMWSVE